MFNLQHSYEHQKPGRLAVAHAVGLAQGKSKGFFHIDNRPRSITQMKQTEVTPTPQKVFQKKANATGLPDNLKSGIENLSGHSMDDVKVHYNSSQPAQLNAHAFAQGNQIHIASGQEKHLPHEAWHVVQQKQGRVKPTKQFKGKTNINDDASLEKEADVMGAKAASGAVQQQRKNLPSKSVSDVAQRMPGDYDRIKPLEGKTVTVEYVDHSEWIRHTGLVSNVKSTSIYIGSKRFVRSWLDDFSFRIISTPGPKLLDNPASVGEYIGAMSSGKSGWKAMSLDNRIRLLQGNISPRFESNGIPPPTIHLLRADDHRNGEFDSTSWTFGISETALNKDMATPAATAYHESRHAEQYFLMARYILQNGIKPPHSKQIPDAVLVAAGKANTAAPLAGTDLEKAETFYHSIFGKGFDHRQMTLKMLAAYTPGGVAQKAEIFKKNKEDYDAKYKICKDYADLHKANALKDSKPWPDEQQTKNMDIMKLAREMAENSRQQFLAEDEKQKKAHAAYMDLPEEKEAHALGDMVRSSLEEL